MSYLTEINSFLDSTRNCSTAQLNKMIAELDRSAVKIESAAVAHSVLGYMKSAELKGGRPVFSDALARAEGLKARQAWLFVEHEAVKPEAVKQLKAAPAPVARKARVNKGEQAKMIYQGLVDKSKANVMAVFMEKLGTTAAGAQTYFYACGGEKTGRKGRAPNGEKREVIRVVKNVGPTKKEKAAELYAAAADKGREAVIALFMSELGMTKTGATTYYYNVGGTRVRSSK